MLVLTRRLRQKILFPGIDATVQVVEIKPGAVRLGIEAPAEVAVFREEVWQRTANSPVRHSANGAGNNPQTLKNLHHLVRKRLSVAQIGLALLRRQIQAGLTQDAEATLERMEQELQMLAQRVEGELAQAFPPASPRHKALLVDDDKNERELMAGYLRLAGLEVATAFDGCDALDYLRTQDRPDFVLLDMLMPRCDGLATARAIRRDPRLAGVKIFAVTCRTPEECDGDVSSAGIDRWFQKPIDPEVLLHDVKQELGSPSLSRC